MKKVALLIFALFLLGAFFMGWLYFKQHREKRRADPRFTISSIAQKGPGRGEIPSEQLALLMGLSQETAGSLYDFDCRNAEERLGKSPRILSARVSIALPSIVVVEYSARRPLVLLADKPGCALSVDGEVIPLWDTPALPKLVLGKCAAPLPYILQLLEVFPEPDAEFDLSRLGRSFVEREIVVTLNVTPPVYLRLHPERLREGLQNYQKLLPHLEPEGIIPQTIDLRSPGQAFITELEEHQ